MGRIHQYHAQSPLTHRYLQETRARELSYELKVAVRMTEPDADRSGRETGRVLT